MDERLERASIVGGHRSIVKLFPSVTRRLAEEANRATSRCVIYAAKQVSIEWNLVSLREDTKP
jgi:hypothetical protein